MFEEHPQKVLHDREVPLLTIFDERVALLKEAGMERILSFHFAEVRHYTAEQFMRLLREQYDVQLLAMGYDHHFGSDRLSNFADYERAAARAGLRLLALPRNPESEASSTKIRKALESGDVEQAQRLLGYPYTLTGRVVDGRKIGRSIGFPTANLALPAGKLIPAAGVYACEVKRLENSSPGLGEVANGQRGTRTYGRKAVLNIGTNPTVHGTEQTIELHLPGFEGDLYGQTLSVSLLRYLRPEQTFSDLGTLRAQIEQDIRAVMA